MAIISLSNARSENILMDQHFPSRSEIQDYSKRFVQIASAQPEQARVMIKKSLTELRQQVQNGISLYRINLPKPEKGLRQYMQGFPHISECHCSSGLTRSKGEENGRELLEAKIADFAVQQLKPQGIKPYLLSVGSGGLAQELQVCQALSAQSINNFKLALIDFIYKEDSCMKAGCKQDMVHEFLTLLHVGLGLNITQGTGDQLDCATVNAAIESFKKSPVYSANPDNTHNIEIAFFPTTEKFLKTVSKDEGAQNQTRPNIIFDSDFKNDLSKRNKIMNDPLNASDQTALYVSLGKYSRFHNTHGTHVDLETKLKLDGVWNKSKVTAIQPGTCSHKSPAQIALLSVQSKAAASKVATPYSWNRFF